MFVPLVHSESTLGPGDLSIDVAGVGDVIDQVISFDVSLYIFDCKCQKKNDEKITRVGSQEAFHSLVFMRNITNE